MLPGHHCLIDVDPVSMLLMRGQSPSPLQPVWVNTVDMRTQPWAPLPKRWLTIPHQNPFHTPFSFSGPHLVSLTRQSSSSTPPPPPSCSRAVMLSAHHSILVSWESPRRWEPGPPNGSLEKEQRVGQQVKWWREWPFKNSWIHGGGHHR